ncbi:DUF1254 domain-containing protein [Demequina sp. NBRC 110054]|uniref:DUF1254 domain-containing protein n=1 Tax=Demequina sp. NBRC 110054 TaxID=1570343 RepID=UPI0009FBEB1E|nr:DUF1254 domain-containing protein [Demequina sp. NBRC 110054]
MSIHVNVDNFVRAETDRMLVANQRIAGGVNRLHHNRVPTPIDSQPVVRMNRDTLYSLAVLDLAKPVELVLPHAGDRYMSAMVVNNDHYVPLVLHSAGKYWLSVTEAGTRYALVAIRILVDPVDPADVEAVQALQDGIDVVADGGEDLVMPDYNLADLDATRTALEVLGSGLDGYDGAFGAKGQVDPIRHLIGTATGWGGLPSSEAVYVSAVPDDPAIDSRLTLVDVPVDAFWSVSVYNDEGFFEPNPHGRYSVNSVTAVPDETGAVEVRFVHGAPEGPNDIPVPERWGIVTRLYQPHDPVLTGAWRVPPLSPVASTML